MPIDLKNEQPITLTQAARMLPPGRSGKPVGLSCIFRWITAGIRLPDGSRAYLEAARLGGRWLTTIEALERFAARQTPSREEDKPPLFRTPRRRRRAVEAAARDLERIGI